MEDWVFSKAGLDELDSSCTLLLYKGRAIAEAVSCWLPTATARVRARVWLMGFVVDEVASG
jgi:hypothetical protein